MNRIAAAVVAVLVIAGVGYFVFSGGGPSDRVSGEPLRAYVEEQLKAHNVSFEAVTYDEGKDTVVVTKAVAPAGLIPFYKEFKAERIAIRGGDKRAFETVFDLEKNKKAAADGADFLLLAKEFTIESASGAVDSEAMKGAMQAQTGPSGPGEFAEVMIDSSITVTFDSGSIKDYAVKPIGRSPFDLQFPQDVTDENMRAFMVRAGEFISSFQYGAYELKGIKYSVVNPHVNVAVTLESVASSGFAEGRIDWAEAGPLDLKIGGEEVTSEAGGEITASIKSMRLDKMDMSKLIEAMKDGSIFPKDKDSAPILTEWSPVVGAYKVADVTVIVPGSGSFTLEELSASELKTYAGLTLGGNGALKNLVIPGTALADTGAKPIMDALGAEDLRINISAKAKFNEKKKVWDMSKFTVKVDKFGTLDTNFRFGGLGFLTDLVGMPANELVKGGMSERILSEMTFGRLVISYTDAGAANYALDMMAKQSGMERGQMAAQYVAQFDAMRAQFGEVPALNELSQSLSVFLQDPKSLTISFKPKEPVPLQTISAMGLAAPGQLATTLGMSSKAN